MRKILIYLFSCFIICIFTVNATQVVLTDAEKDGYILFKYSLDSANSSNSQTSSKKVECNKTIYEFKDHVLSCGTHMTGVITKIENNGKIVYTGTFSVDKNSFNITKLSIDFNETLKNPIKRAGTIKINDKTYDINLFFN